jgi:hypothetical protein
MHTPLIAQTKKKVSKPQGPVSAEKNGKLTYGFSEKGDRIPD